MATVAATSLATTTLVHTVFLPKKLSKVQVVSPIHGLPVRVRRGRVRCTMEDKPWSLKVASSMAAAATVVATGPAVALVDERMSTEGTGLPFGLSNNLLGWILLGVFGLIWALYFVYTSSLEEDEDSGLSL